MDLSLTQMQTARLGQQILFQETLQHMDLSLMQTQHVQLMELLAHQEIHLNGE